MFVLSQENLISTGCSVLLSPLLGYESYYTLSLGFVTQTEEMVIPALLHIHTGYNNGHFIK